MANRKISDLTTLTAPATGDLLPIVDISEAAAADKNKKITFGELLSSAPAGTAAAPSFSFDADPNTGIFNPAADTIAFAEGGAEAMRIDSSGRILVGTSTARSNFYNQSQSSSLQLESLNTTPGFGRYSTVYNSNDDNSTTIIFGKTRGTTVGSSTIVANNDSVGFLSFQAADGTELVETASISAAIDGTPGANDMPGRIVFSTTSDGASSPTERMRIKSNGTINFSNVATYADNTTAAAAGLAVGDVYKTVLGVLMIRY
jgi:hypothetical protein